MVSTYSIGFECIWGCAKFSVAKNVRSAKLLDDLKWFIGFIGKSRCDIEFFHAWNFLQKLLITNLLQLMADRIRYVIVIWLIMTFCMVPFCWWCHSFSLRNEKKNSDKQQQSTYFRLLQKLNQQFEWLFGVVWLVWAWV